MIQVVAHLHGQLHQCIELSFPPGGCCRVTSFFVMAGCSRYGIGWCKNSFLRTCADISKIVVRVVSLCLSRVFLHPSSSPTVVFHSIRHPAWRVTTLPKFWFRQAPDLTVTSNYFSAGRGKFSASSQRVCQWSVPAYTDNESSGIIANEGNKGCKNPDKYLNIQVTG